MTTAITPTQADVLIGALRAGGEVDFEAFILDRDQPMTQVQFGLSRTLAVLQRRGLVDVDTMLTDAGRWAAMRAWVATDLPVPRIAQGRA